MVFEHIFALKATMRINDLREAYLQGPLQTQTHSFYYSGDRWMTLPFLEGWLKYRDEPTTVLRRAKTEAYVLDCYKPIILDGELIVGQMDHQVLTDEEQARFDHLNEMFRMSPYIHHKGRTDHLCLDYTKLLRVGVNGLLDEIRQRRSQLDFAARKTFAQNVEKDEFYEGAIIELEALLRMAERYAVHARKLAETASPERAAELETIAQIMEHVPAQPARTFREALQSCHFYTYHLFGLYPGGRPDQFLYPFYRRDVDAGILTQAEAQELIDNYTMQFSQFAFSSSACGYMVGGRDANGQAVNNELTALFLNAIRHIRMALPGPAFAICKETSEELIMEALRLLEEGHTHPALYNDEAITASLINYGIDPADAHNYVHTTCAEITICGKSDTWTTCPWHSLLRIFMEQFEALEFDNVETLYQAFEQAVRREVEEGSMLQARIQMERARNGAMPLRVSCLVDDCLARGSSLAQGGARYNWVMPTFVGMANVVDSLVAIDHVVFREKRATLAELRQILAENFDNHEVLHSWIMNCVPHLGNAQNECDVWMVRLMKMLDEVCQDKWTYRNDITVPGAFSFSLHDRFGNQLGATPDGRLAQRAVANCPLCMQGCDTTGPTALLLSGTNWSQPRFLGGVVGNLMLTRRIFEGNGIHAVRSLLKSYFDRDGIQLQINVVDRAVLKEAAEHPEEHRNLVVRVGGYSEYFTRLSPELQQDLIMRTPH